MGRTTLSTQISFEKQLMTQHQDSQISAIMMVEKIEFMFFNSETHFQLKTLRKQHWNFVKPIYDLKKHNKKKSQNSKPKIFPKSNLFF